MSLFTIDFEASCLPGFGKSYPIEVGICEVETGHVETWLIKPAAEWRDWGWDPAAEALHGLSRAELETAGSRVGVVLSRLHGLAPDMRVVSDSNLDGYWLGVLSEAARFPPPFEVESLGDILAERPVEPPTREAFGLAKEEAMRRFPEAHNAGDDARRLAEVIRILAGSHSERWLATY